MFRTPRTKFAESTHAAAWKKLVQSEMFEEATHDALLEFQRLLVFHANASAAHEQVVGAQRYIEVLYEICTKEEPLKIDQPKGLNYAAGV